MTGKKPSHDNAENVGHDNKGDLEKVASDNDCDSDSTIDIRIRNKQSRRKKDVKKDSSWTVNEIDDEDWEIPEEDSDNNDDTTSVVTNDTIAQQMMY